MIEPATPITIRVLPSSYPAFLLANEDDVKFKPSSAFLRYRHLRQQQRIIRRSVVQGMSSGSGQSKTTPGIRVEVASTSASTSRELSLPLRQEGLVRPSSSPSPPVLNTTSTPSTSGTGPDKSRSAVTQGNGNVDAQAKKLAVPVGDVGPSRSSGDSATLAVDRHDHAIRSRNEKIVWFSSSGDAPLQAPPSVSASRYCDLYVHSVAGGSVQVWLCDESGTWNPVQMFHPHPYLRGHVLNILPNHEPRWVTKDTARTYKARAKKRVRDVSVASNSSAQGVDAHLA
ncbi:hypothetical protein FKP32DRAFT_1586433 [Trametes sanguinea]|nr:hypothetical protein FKP32DRAFT_1586433 [Trametes sanguinea]